MSEYLITVLACDRCAPGYAPTVVHGEPDVPLERGLCIGIPFDIAKSLGWQYDEDGYQNCPACVEEIKRLADTEEGAEHGAASLGVFYKEDENG